MIALEFLKSELKSHNIELKPKNDGREGVDFLIGNNQIYLQPLDLYVIKQNIKISKQDLGALNDNLFIALVLILEKEPRVVYLIPSKELQDSNNNFFVNNDVSLMPSLSNWEIKISSNVIHKLEIYTIPNQIEKLRQ